MYILNIYLYITNICFYIINKMMSINDDIIWSLYWKAAKATEK